MADIELIIKMPEEDYEYIKNSNDMNFNVIKNGTLLPKGHGRLIDADVVIKKMDERINRLGDDKSIYEASCVETALNMGYVNFPVF